MSQSAPPQLHMIRRDLRELPRIHLPTGYALRTFQEGDGPHWSSIYAEAFDRPYASDHFDRIMKSDPAFRPERIWLVVCGELPVATASAYMRPRFMADTGMIHYVATRPSHAGKRLGEAATIAALRHMVAEGLDAAWLSTDDFRLAAIRLYLRLGFAPLVVHSSHRERWLAVFQRLGLEPSEETRAALDAPLFVPAGS